MKKHILGYASLVSMVAGTTTQGGQTSNPEDLQASASVAQDVMNNEVTEESCIQIINSRRIATEPGKYQVKVTNVTPYERPEEQGGLLTQINNYDLMTPYNLQEAKRLFNEGDYTGAASQKLSSSSRIGIDYCPMKGEIVEVVLDIIETKNRPEGALLVKAVQPLRTKVAASVKFNPKGTEETSLIDPANVAVVNREKSIARAQEKGATLTGKPEEPQMV